MAAVPFTYTFREPTADERELLGLLTERAGLDPAWMDDLLVADMNDGGMGSLRFAFGGVDDAARMMRGTPAEHWYLDADGTPVLAALILDKQGVPFELDSWKVDFGRLISRLGPPYPDGGSHGPPRRPER